MPASLAVRGHVSGSGLTLAVHVAALAVLAAALAKGDAHPESPRGRLIALAPLIVIPFLYAELPTLMSGLRDGYLDRIVQPWEYAIFGGETPARTLAPAVHRTIGTTAGTLISDVLFASYLSYYFIIYLPPLALLVQRKHGLYARTLAGMMAAFLVCYLVFVVFPVEGPRYIWPAPDAAMHGPIRALTLRLVNMGSSRGAEFPSSHVAVSVAQSIMALRWQRRIGIGVGICTVLLSFAVIFAGFHYAVDVMAGWVVGGLIGWAIARKQWTAAPA